MIKYEFEGHKFQYPEWELDREDGLWKSILYAMPGEFHPNYCLYSYMKSPYSWRDILELNIMNAALNIIDHADQWIKECDEREGAPPE